MNEERLEIQHASTFCLGVHATLSLSFSLSLTGEQGAHILFTGQREMGVGVGEREKEGGERERKKERERDVQYY